MKWLSLITIIMMGSTNALADFNYKGKRGNWVNVGDGMSIDKNSIRVDGYYRFADVISAGEDYRIWIDCRNSNYSITQMIEWIDTVPMTPERRIVDMSCRKR